MTSNFDLSSIYFDPKNPGSFGGVENLYKSAKSKYPSITKREVEKWLASKFEYTLYKDARKRWKRNRIYVSHIDEQWECDLLDYSQFSRYNKGFKYLLIVIDVFSKYLMVTPLKTKKADVIVGAFISIFEFLHRKPLKIRSDRGLEFENFKFRKMCKEYNINFFTTTNSTVKCAIVERVNRTLRNKLERYMAHNGSRRYIDDLQKIVASYNNSIHRSIKMPPSQVSRDDEPIVFQNLYNARNIMDIINSSKMKPRFSTGDNVRQKYDLKPLEKSYYQRWTDIVYKIDKVMNHLFKPQYRISHNGVQFKRTFYPEELQRVNINDNSLFLVDKILKYRIRNKQKEAFVKWKGFTKQYNEWIPTSQIQNL